MQRGKLSFSAEELQEELEAQLAATDRQLRSFDQRQDFLREEIAKSSERSRALRGDLARNDNLKAAIQRKREMHRELVNRLKDIQLLKTKNPRR